jgi:hypothetical protein
MGTFWKIHFINPPEVQGQIIELNRTGEKRQLKNTLRWMDSQEENSLRKISPKSANVTDFRLKCCLEGQNFKIIS